MTPSTLLVSSQIAATALVSLVSIHLAGAGKSAIALQTGAFLLGAILVATRKTWMAFVARTPAHWLTGSVLLVAAAVHFFGVDIDGARRWLRAGPIMLQPAVLLGSLLLLALARANAGALAAMLAGVAIFIVGAGNDGGSSLAYALGMTGLLIGDPAKRKIHLPLWLLACGMAIWGWTRPDTLPAVAYVEEVISRAATQSAMAGIAASLALALLPLVFVLAARKRATRGMGLALAGFWTGLAIAGIVGNFPVPVIGYGASAVIGWILASGLVEQDPGETRISPAPGKPA